MGKLVVFSGPSGAGKTTLGKMCRLPLFTTYTSRLPRDGERDGVDYHFISREEMLTMYERGELAEFVHYAGNYYGTTNKQVADLMAGEQIYYTVLTNEGIDQYIELMSKRYIYTIGLYCSELNAYTRLRQRYGDDSATIVSRMQSYAKETGELELYDTVINTDVPIDMSLHGVLAIIKLLYVR